MTTQDSITNAAIDDLLGETRRLARLTANTMHVVCIVCAFVLFASRYFDSAYVKYVAVVLLSIASTISLVAHIAALRHVKNLRRLIQYGYDIIRKFGASGTINLPEIPKFSKFHTAWIVKSHVLMCVGGVLVCVAPASSTHFAIILLLIISLQLDTFYTLRRSRYVMASLISVNDIVCSIAKEMKNDNKG